MGLQYMMFFEWSEDRERTADATATDLEADRYEAARVKAAIRYAGASFMQDPPDGFRIVGSCGSEVYRFPEATAH